MTASSHQFSEREDRFADRVGLMLDRAASCGFPLFLQPIADSNPGNSSPFIANLADLERIFVGPERQELFSSLTRLLGELEASGNPPCILLLGGSFLDARCKPNDLDGLLLCEEGAGISNAIKLVEIYKAKGLDLRIYPFDGNPLMVVKMVSFFSILYASNRKGIEAEGRGLLLIDLLSTRRIGRE